VKSGITVNNCYEFDWLVHEGGEYCLGLYSPEEKETLHLFVDQILNAILQLSAGCYMNMMMVMMIM